MGTYKPCRVNFIKRHFNAYLQCKFFLVQTSIWKLDGVGPVDNRPSTDELHYFVKKKMGHVTRDTGHMTHDT